MKRNYLKMIRTGSAIVLCTFILQSCKKEKATTVDFNVLAKESAKKVSLKNNEEKINYFFKSNETVTEDSYKDLYEYIRLNYPKNRERYKVIIHIANKGLKEDNPDMKNIIYTNLKKEYSKI